MWNISFDGLECKFEDDYLTEATKMLCVEVEREDDGRWIAEVAELPGVLAYGQSREEAVERAKALFCASWPTA
jgi:hypothetical protein